MYARVFFNSSCYQIANSHNLFPDWKRNINGVDIPILTLGDPAYPLLPWLMKPYPDTGNLSNEKQRFNYQQSRARMVIENSFSRLKGRWRCLVKRMDYYNVDHVINVVAMCIVLHNICELAGDNCDESWTAHLVVHILAPRYNLILQVLI